MQNVTKNQSKNILSEMKLDQAFRLAKKNAEENKFEDAILIYESILQKFPRNSKAKAQLKALTKLNQEDLNSLIRLYRSRQYLAAINKADNLLKKHPKSIILYEISGASNAGLKKFDEAADCFMQSIKIKPDNEKAHYNLGNIYIDKGDLNKAINSFQNAIKLKPNYYEAYNNLGNAMYYRGDLNNAIDNFQNAIDLKPDYADAYNNMGNAYNSKGALNEAVNSLKQAIRFRPNYADAFWNLYGTSVSFTEAQNWIERCLEADKGHEHAILTSAALKAYSGDTRDLDALRKSEFKEHSYMRSFDWVFGLPTLPLLFFNRWAFFDFIIQESTKDRPFYEYGVFRGHAFEYLIKTYKIGYGFDTFTGLPEDWHDTKAGTYSSEGMVPNIKGGNFISGKFEDSLPKFFEQKRPLASIINFDADLYSSTICAMTYSKPVIDEQTILVFDEFIMNKNWENDEYKALIEFCKKNKYLYEVIAVSFNTKQVAVKLVSL